jgi:pyruvate dehydrogenase E2 component (dihydrolipoamide acetyltransferase)
MSTFKLPDLGEGLAEAEIREWHVRAGDEVKPDQLLLSVETDKAVVDIPSPQGGRVAKLHGKAGDIIHVGDPLVEFDGGAGAPAAEKPKDAGSVVGRVEHGAKTVQETALGVGAAAAAGLKVTPAVRALAHRLNVDLSIVTPTGPDGLITQEDIQRVARILQEVGPMEPLRGVRRAMARTMATAHAEVVAVTVSDDTDITPWSAEEDITIRLIRAIVAGCRAEPALNGWYDGHALARRLLKEVHLGIAVDTEDGLFVPLLRNVDSKTREQLRAMVDEMKRKVRDRSVPPEELRGYTFTLSNFGTFAGRYADPVIVPPTMAILGAGKIREAVWPIDGKPQVRRILPLSLTFDHRACTGGEATRFLAAVMQDLAAAT